MTEIIKKVTEDKKITITASDNSFFTKLNIVEMLIREMQEEADFFDEKKADNTSAEIVECLSDIEGIVDELEKYIEVTISEEDSKFFYDSQELQPENLNKD